MADEDLFEQGLLEATQSTDEGEKKEKRVVKTKRTIKVKVKAKEPVEETKEPIEEQGVAETEKVEKPRRKVQRKPKKKVNPEVEVKSEEEQPTLIDVETITPEPVVELPPATVEVEEKPQEEIATQEVTPTEEAINEANTETPSESESEEKSEEDSSKTNKQINLNKKNKFNKNQKPKREETIEVNLEENPDAPLLFVSYLTTLPVDNLRELARQKGIAEDVILDCRKQDLIKEMCRLHSFSGGALMVEGTIEILPDGFGFLRYSINSYLSGSEDVYLSAGMIRGCGLRTGDTVYGQIRTPRDTDRFYSMFRVMKVNEQTPQEAKLRVPFDTLTPLFPDEKLDLQYVSDSEKPDTMDIATRVVDLFCPIGKGQRSIIVAPPRTGKTVLMQKIANAITTNHPEVKLFVLLVDERPEEVTDMRRNVKGEVVASTFDEQATRHVQVAEMVIEKAKRLVELHKDVVILLDSITRLARAYNQTVPASGKILSGGVDSNALHKPKRFFGAARNIENGGSLTIISTALIETGSRMDEVIFEEFKGTGNNEIVLDRRMADSRKFPAINIKKSGTRRDDLILSKDELTRLWLLRNAVSNMDDLEMSVFLIDKMKKTHNNKEFLASMSGAAVSSATQTMSVLK